MRHSLLRNNGDGTFSDVTVEAGINIVPAVASQTAAWGDYDNDGWLDLFVGAEHAPSHLFHNNGDGTFTDVSKQARVDRTAFTKGAVWGDYDNDGYVELYVSNEGESNFLYHYNGDGTFTEIARDLHVETPIWSFPVWFWDYDNDGWLDLYVSSHYESVSEVVKSYLRLPTPAETHALYRNRNGKGFQNVTQEVGLDQVTMPMGANFGDVDNDGFLDFYLGTGAPSYGAFIPNMLFRNVAGKRFVDITASSGTGLLQKGHGVAIGNLFHDAFAHPQGLLLELALTRLTKLVDLALHVLDVRDLVIALFGLLRLGVGAQSGGIELFVEVVNFIERLFIGVGALVVFFFGLVFCVVNLGLRVFSFAVFPKCAVHIDRADF